jgi:4-amino-4-deoxy-L-arabinose transferase-like glycosyltransferase
MTTSESQPTRAPDDQPAAFSRREVVVFVAVLLFYAATRLVGLADYPIYFFCDEATQANLAEELIDNGLRDPDGNLFPPYFLNAKVYNLGLSIWMHASTVALFGKSVVVVRATSVAIGLFGAAALMIALRYGFKTRLWWLGGLTLAVLPGWFLHSRTAFETAMMVGFYAAFICAYLLYRLVSPWWSVAAVVLGAATFYSYSNGQGVMFVTCLLLLISDARYHWQVLRSRPRVAAAAAAAVVAVAWPYLRFRFILHPNMMADHFTDLHSYWVTDIPLSEKIHIFIATYGEGLSPAYWFVEDTGELVRHRMKGYGYLPLWLAPAIAIGLGESLWRASKSSAHRLLLIAILAAPFSAAMVDIRITRVLSMMVPAAMLAVLGLDRIRRWAGRFVPANVFAALAAAGLAVAASVMASDALRNGPLWFTDYGMSGMQWGAQQLYDEIRPPLESNPDLRFVVSHSWANWPDAFPPFFLEDPLPERVRMGVIEEYMEEYRPRELSTNTIFVLTHYEYETATTSGMFELGAPLAVVEYPDGRTGFYLSHMAYSADAEEIFLDKQAERRRRVESHLELEGTRTHVIHPRFDDGGIEALFDGKLETIARTLDADPCVLTFTFSQPRRISGIRLTVWTPRYLLNLRVQGIDGATREARSAVDYAEGFQTQELRLTEPVSDTRLVEIVVDKQGDTKVHLQEVEFLP